MTAETLKSFIALPSSGSTYNKSKRNVNLITICISTFFALVCLTLLGFLIFNCVRVNHLEQEVASLKQTIDGMQKRLGFDYLDDLNEFEDAYSNDLLEDAHQGDLLDSFEDEDEGEFGDEEEGSAAYEFDDENYDDSDDSTSDDIDNVYDDVMKFLASKKRKQRSVPSRPDVTDSAALIYESKSTNRNTDEFNIIGETSDESSKGLNIDQESSEKTDTRNPRARRTNSNMHSNWHRRTHHKHHRRGYFEPTGRYVLKRRSGNNRLLKSGASRKYEDNRRASHHSNLVALHYIINGTFSSQKHHLYHRDIFNVFREGDIYVGHPQAWVKGLAMDKSFEIENGFITILENGIYFIYAQIFYNNEMGRNGFLLYRNSHPFLQCALTVPMNTLKGNTCHTSGVTYLEKNDTVHLQDLYRNRIGASKGPQSFFGIVKLSDASEN